MSALKNNSADIIWKKPAVDLQIISFQAHFALNELYLIKVEAKSTSPSLNPKDLLNKEAQFVLKSGADLSYDRKLGGIITRFSQGRTRHGNLKQAKTQVYLYHLEIRPKLFLLTRVFRTKVYQEMTVRDIVTKVLDDHGVEGQWELDGSLSEREYVVQYAETDYNFICRLLEDEGIAFFFDQEEGVVVFSDFPGGFPDCRPNAEAFYVEEISPKFQFGKHEFIQDFNYEEVISTGKAVVHNYNYETALIDLLKEKEEDKAPLFSDLESYEHTQGYPDLGEGGRYAKLHLEAHHAHAKLGSGTTSCRSFEAGYVVKIKDHFRGDLNGRWLLTSANITAEQGHYRCQFTALLAEIPYRPACKTPRPKVYGLQTAVVTGPEMTEPYLDPMGRCKLQFHWDREGPKDEGSSMWVRISNNYAGKDYGIQWIPRVGHEVLVTFIDGNPDLPIVTGRVYNSFNTNPLGPEQKYRNIIKTIKDNHIIFDDQDGHELIDIRAHLDMTTLVERNDTQTIGNNRQIDVGKNHSETIGKDMTITVERDLTESVARDYRESVHQNYTLTVDKNMSTRVSEFSQLDVGKSLSETVQENIQIRAGGTYSLDVSQQATVSVGKNIQVTGDKKATMIIADELQVKVGSASLTLKKNGDIEIKGKNLNVKCSGNVTVKGSKIGLN